MRSEMVNRQADRRSISFRGIRKSYGDVTVLKPTDLEVREGEFVTLLGPSGSGKTTLLNVVAGIVAADQGELRIGERDVTRLSSGERGVGMVFQNYALMPHFTVFENVAFPLRIRKLPSATIAAKVGEVLDLVGMAHLADRKPKQLSGGQQQRVSIARCLVYEPSIVLMDEPLGALDKKLRSQLQTEIKKLHERLGFTALYVTHDQDEAMSLSDRICLMDHGEIVQIDTPAELYANPRSRFAAEFLGDANLIPGVSANDGGLAVIEGPANIRHATGENLAAGSRRLMLLRPESIHVLSPGERMDQEIEARVEQVAFFGDHVRLTTSSGPDLTLTASLRSSPETIGLRPGSNLRLGWNSQAITLLPEA